MKLAFHDISIRIILLDTDNYETKYLDKIEENLSHFQ